MSVYGDAVKQRALRVRPTPAIEKHISKALGHYLRIQILWILNERIASPSELATELSEPLNRVSGHIKVLKDAGCIELVDQVIVGHAVQNFYRATARVFFDDTDWMTVPPTIKEGLRITLLQNLIDDAIAALENETYDARDGSHMSWSPMLIDDQGREEISDLLQQTLQQALAIQERAAKRLHAAKAEGISYSVSILGYPSIGGVKRLHPAGGDGAAQRDTTSEKATKSDPRKRAGPKAAGSRSGTKRKPKRKKGGKAVSRQPRSGD